jgi:hypothetical protein
MMICQKRFLTAPAGDCHCAICDMAREELTRAWRARIAEDSCECGHDYAQHHKGPATDDYCRHCPCPEYTADREDVTP